MMDKNEIRLMSRTQPRPALSLDSPLTYKEMAKRHGMTEYEVRRELGLIQ